MQKKSRILWSFLFGLTESPKILLTTGEWFVRTRCLIWKQMPYSVCKMNAGLCTLWWTQYCDYRYLREFDNTTLRAHVNRLAVYVTTGIQNVAHVYMRYRWFYSESMSHIFGWISFQLKGKSVHFRHSWVPKNFHLKIYF